MPIVNKVYLVFYLFQTDLNLELCRQCQHSSNASSPRMPCELVDSTPAFIPSICLAVRLRLTSLLLNRWELWYAKTHLSESESRSVPLMSRRGKFCTRPLQRRVQTFCALDLPACTHARSSSCSQNTRARFSNSFLS